jgi:hypothetical protein
VYVVMPQIEDVCLHADTASVELHVVGPGPEDFIVRGEGCAHQPTYDFDGLFKDEDGGPLRFEHLQHDFYWVTARVYGSKGELRGERVQPFDAREPQMAIAFDRPDLPGWPMGELEVAIPACAFEDGLENVRVSVKPALAHVPDVRMVSCRDGRVRLPAPRGPVVVTGEGMFSDGSVCFKGTASAVVDSDTDAELPLTRSCR